ncbi:MAG: GatB/YqeY domain-containing protein [Acidobacteria bacterium]|nr:GatB/YqeY domain-containing protein [Acidobacteriota bacterium]MCA1611895.1 GatB/YqeY domain-containing protein [Acidobacteriota bacterium]
MLARLENDLKVALKAGEKRRVSTLRLLLSALKNEKIHLQRALTDEEVEAAIRRAVKQRREAIEQYGLGGRADLVAAETEELGILEAYLPRPLSEADLESVVRGIIRDKGFASARDVGSVMKEVMAQHKGRVDGKRAQEIARRLLA